MLAQQAILRSLANNSQSLAVMVENQVSKHLERTRFCDAALFPNVSIALRVLSWTHHKQNVAQKSRVMLYRGSSLGECSVGFEIA